MRGLFVILIVLVVVWYLDDHMYGGRFFAAFRGMLSEIAHHAR
jgi:hypothetical protein